MIRKGVPLIPMSSVLSRVTATYASTAPEGYGRNDIFLGQARLGKVAPYWGVFEIPFGIKGLAVHGCVLR